MRPASAEASTGSGIVLKGPVAGSQRGCHGPRNVARGPRLGSSRG